ncbi:TPA: hypothetical protein QDZ10_001578 [Stenotrophomonas maltophilia]|nr:hypothetical protein [Stenotrophomonas maltophilia]
MPMRNPSIASTPADGRFAHARQPMHGWGGLAKRHVCIAALLIAMVPSVHAAEASRSSVKALNHALGMDAFWAKTYDVMIGSGLLAEFNRSIDDAQRACVSDELKKGLEHHATNSVIMGLGSTGQDDVDAWMTFLATPAGQWFGDAFSSHMQGALVPANAEAIRSGGQPAARSFPTPPHSLFSALQTFASSPTAKRVLATYGDLQNPTEGDYRRMMKTMEATCGVKFQAPNY